MEIRLLGPVELWGEGGKVQLGTPQQRCVLAVLAMAPGRPVSPDTLVDRVWGEQAPPHVREALYSHVSRLRGAVRRMGGAALVRRDGGYVLEVGPDRVDLHRARRSAAEARAVVAGSADGDARAARLLREACELWRGTPLTGLPGDWAARVRSALDQERLTMLTERFEVELRHGRLVDAVAPLSAAQAEYPLSEPLAGLLMLALYRTGRQTEALGVYARARQRLVDEIGDEPAGWLRELHGRILRRDETLTDHAGTPVTVSQVRPAQLPPDVAAFTGRARELRELDALLPDEAGPTAVVISALAGTAGVGKTALAAHWAHRVRHRFPDGQLYADLRGFAAAAPAAPAAVLARFLRALGTPPEQVPPDADEAAALYRSLLADKRMLVVLDNAADPYQVRPLLPGGGGSLVLVTSRDRLGGLVARDGAHRVVLDVLAHDDSVALLTGLLGAGRVDAEPAEVAELARLCGHLPLALRVAAANLGAHPRQRIGDYVGQLRDTDRLAALTLHGDEQSAVPAAFDLSYTRLPAPVRRMFRLLGLVPGPDVTAGAAAALAGVAGSQAGRLLDALAAAHLVEERTAGRYSCHDLLRRYAAERAHVEEAEPERDAALARLYQFYLWAADAAVRAVNPVFVRLPLARPVTGPPAPTGADGSGGPDQPGEPGGAAAWLEVERANLVAAVTGAAERGSRSVAWQLADVLRGYFMLSPFGYEWRSVARAGLAAATADGDDLALAAAHLNLAHLWFRQSRYRDAVRHATDALAHARSAGWVEGDGAILNILGSAYWPLGELGPALDHFARSVAVFERLGWKQAVAALHGNLARVCAELGRLAEAADHAERGLAETRALGVVLGEAINLEILGEVHHARGEPRAAIELFTRARELSRAAGYRSGEGDALHGLAAVHWELGERDRAAGLAHTALALAREQGLRRLEADCVNLLAEIDGSDLDGHQRALALARRTGHRHPEVAALIGLAVAYLRRGDHQRARVAAGRALALARAVGYRLLEGRARVVLGHAELALGRVEDARRHWLAARAGFAGAGATGPADRVAALLAQAPK